jgi:hypothetical protein
MANLGAIHSVGDSLAKYLERAYPPALKAKHDCSFSLISSTELADPEIQMEKNLTLFLYRVTLSEHLRNAGRGFKPGTGRPVSLDLHYMLTIWQKTAEAEQTILAWALRELQMNPVLDRSYLTPVDDWSQGESVQFLYDDLSLMDMLRVWDAIRPSYRLSVPYIARVVQIDVEGEEGKPVVSTRFSYGEKEIL